MVAIAMKKYLNISQALLAAALMIITILIPLISLSSSSLRRPTTYVYFIINLIIIALGAEAGLLSFLFTNHHHRHGAAEVNKPAANSVNCSINIDPAIGSSDHQKKGHLEKSVSDKVTAAAKVTVKKCPSMPSIFFIGGSAAEEEEKEEAINDQLFTKAETFIENFYKQLEMQRQESWKRIHGFYYNHKAF